MTKEQIVKISASLPLPAGSYWLVMGAALVMHGIRQETRDIDIGCTHDAFDFLLTSGHQISTSRSGLRKVALDSHISVYDGFFTKKILWIDGIPVSDLESIRTIKSFFGREKDLSDIKLIDQHLARMNQND